MENSAVNLAVLFADVSGSTRLYEKLGDARALECIGLCLNIGALLMATWPPC